MCFGCFNTVKTYPREEPPRPVKFPQEPGRRGSPQQYRGTRPNKSNMREKTASNNHLPKPKRQESPQAGSTHPKFHSEYPRNSNEREEQATPANIHHSPLVHELSGTGIKSNNHAKDEQVRINNIPGMHELPAAGSRGNRPSNDKVRKDQARHFNLNHQLKGHEKVDKGDEGKMKEIGKENEGQAEGKTHEVLEKRMDDKQAEGKSEEESKQASEKTSRMVSNELPKEILKVVSKGYPKEDSKDKPEDASPKQTTTKERPKEAPKRAIKVPARKASRDAGNLSSYGANDGHHTKHPTRGHGGYDRKHHNGVSQNEIHQNGGYHDAGHQDGGHLNGEHREEGLRNGDHQE
ncbi:hypothetical protein F4820DRAFT_24513 [Hypoxylon rubiginosum]|uniref:Uncharacterized protein n=1 Tax=Hypoxylon rubiginosum TaxID=110542 RepID=A0ACB9YTD3_9PEZI|nr:hypothetical protein F4820DRAFT_24513 [Hypoxylon rubiginosum]